MQSCHISLCSRDIWGKLLRFDLFNSIPIRSTNFPRPQTCDSQFDSLPKSVNCFSLSDFRTFLHVTGLLFQFSSSTVFSDLVDKCKSCVFLCNLRWFFRDLMKSSRVETKFFIVSQFFIHGGKLGFFLRIVM